MSDPADPRPASTPPPPIGAAPAWASAHSRQATAAPLTSRQWVPEIAWLGALVVLVFADPSTELSIFNPPPVAFLGALWCSVLLFRRVPLAALGLVWLAGVAQVTQNSPLTLAQVAVVPVAYGCARYGSVWTAAAAGVSMPLAAALGVLYVQHGGWNVVDYRLADLVDSVRYRADTLTLFSAATLLTLAIPWLLGLLMRALNRSRTAERARDEAQAQAILTQEIAELREAQAGLARDVHDVVGHSLAVILAQAESAQFFADDAPRLQSTLATIATSARSSLADIRHVLGQTGATAALDDNAFTELVEGVRSTGRGVTVAEVGTPRPLPPDLRVVAHRVAQEMLTNAVRHGDGSSAIEMTRFWGETLCIQTRNKTALGEPMSAHGSGILGMLRRLESVGGTLTAVREGDDFVATAWMPTGGLR